MNEEPLNGFYVEILRLHRMLVDAGIPCQIRRLYDGWQVEYPGSEHRMLSAIETRYSYGHTYDTIEIMGLLTPEEEDEDSVLGSLSAEEVFARIKKHFDQTQLPEQ